eukprot:CAMPEP_0181300200 /NCGR_PEP_ID=MMETSP1101-20121128/6761_1 /TAXON_ID=46948 /ORGANISM="Rhodomonas abbreviata, Strain Caron Lab Isolate" /LENGTH=883 /DNA_ID=CAMNT_0023405417 /DNA_START=99 /DNA_END=2748 /DNA_ORIENTATION=-
MEYLMNLIPGRRVTKGPDFAEQMQMQMLQGCATGNIEDFAKAYAWLSGPTCEIFGTESPLLCVDGNGWTCLQLAAGNGHEAVVSEILSRARKDNSIEYNMLIEKSGNNGHTPLTLAISNGHESIACLLIEEGACIDAVNGKSDRNAAFLVASRSMLVAANKIIEKCGKYSFAAMSRETDGNGYSALYAAALANDAAMCEMLIDLGVSVDQSAKDRSTPLHAACRYKSKHQALSPAQERPDGDKCGDLTAIDILLAHCNQNELRRRDSFGCTYIHVAAANRYSLAITKTLSRFPVNALIAQDNDGLHPTHTASQEVCRYAELLGRNTHNEEYATNQIRFGEAMSTLMALLEHGYPVDALDYADATILHILCHRPASHQLEAIRTVLDFIQRSADSPSKTTQELLEKQDVTGWTCLHQAFGTKGMCSYEVCDFLQSLVSPQFLSSLDLGIQREKKDAFGRRSGAHNHIPVEIRQGILDNNYSPAGIAQRLHSLPHTPRVVVVLGAGVSTSAGIPDFRSSNGLYQTEGVASLFSEEAMHSDPHRFYGLLRQMFLPVVDGAIQPTLAHALLRALKNRGWLKRVYTQNVDALEFRLLDPADVVECHGSCRMARCCNYRCNFRLSCDTDMQEHFWGKIRSLPMPMLTGPLSSDGTTLGVGAAGGGGCTTADTARRGDSSQGRDFPLRIDPPKGSDSAQDGDCPHDAFPRCAECGALLRPDVTFFGEALPTRFHKESKGDLPECDLLLVMGTSLVVYPVASLPNMVGPSCVRALVNQTPTGCFQFCPPFPVAPAAASPAGELRTACGAAASSEEVRGAAEERWLGRGYRDVFVQGACDDGAVALANALGMQGELTAILQSLSPEPASPHGPLLPSSSSSSSSSSSPPLLP